MDEFEGTEDFSDILVVKGNVYRTPGCPEMPSFCLVLGRSASGGQGMFCMSFVEEEL